MSIYEADQSGLPTSFYPWIFKCDEVGCYSSTSHPTQAKAELARDTHECRKGEIHYMMGKSIIEKYWDGLDDLVGQIQDENTSPSDREMMKAEAKGVAWCISIIAVPYFTTVKAVSKEALRRYKMRVGELEFEPTPGYNYNPQPAGDFAREPMSPELQAAHDAARATAAQARASAEATSGRPKRATPAPKVRQFTAEETQGIKAAFTAGLFSKEELAGVYKCKVSDIEAIV